MHSIRSVWKEQAGWCRILAVKLLLGGKLILGGILLSSTVVGCGGGDESRQGIYGKVTVDGAPLEKGIITIKPAKGTEGPVVGGPIERGKYQIRAGEGPVVGEHRVEISSTEIGEQKVVVVPGEPPGYRSIETIAPQYNTKSTLTVTIKEGTNEQDFPLDAKASTKGGKR